MMNKILFVIIIILIYSCEQEAEKAIILNIEPFSFIDNSTCSNNTESINITDTWVTVNGNFMGAFEIPSSVPLIGLNEITDLRISPGIKENGISATRIIYPFYEIFEQFDADFDENITIYPTTKFKETVNCKFSSTGSFEGLGDGLLEGAKNNTSVISNTTNPNEVFQGEKSCKISLNSSSNILYASSKEFSFFDDFPILPNNVFLELNFKSSVSFEYGLLNYILNDSIEVECGGINKSDEWKKIYLNLSEQIVPYMNSSVFKIYFKGDFSGENFEDYILLDNIKVIYQ